MLQADVQYNHIGKNAAFQHTKHFGYNVYKKEATFLQPLFFSSDILFFLWHISKDNIRWQVH